MKGVDRPTMRATRTTAPCGACVDACPGEDIIVMQRTRSPREGYRDGPVQEVKENCSPEDLEGQRDVTGEVESQSNGEGVSEYYG